jgi:hypothetical protein
MLRSAKLPLMPVMYRNTILKVKPKPKAKQCPRAHSTSLKESIQTIPSINTRTNRQ